MYKIEELKLLSAYPMDRKNVLIPLFSYNPLNKIGENHPFFLKQSSKKKERRSILGERDTLKKFNNGSQISSITSKYFYSSRKLIFTELDNILFLGMLSWILEIWKGSYAFQI